MSTRNRRTTSPETARKIAAHALQLPCEGCAAPPGEPCTEPGPGRSVCKNRYAAAAIAISRETRAARRTPAQTALLATLPRIPREEIELCRTERGGYAFTKAWFLEHGLPYPPISGWREAVEREDDGSTAA